VKFFRNRSVGFKVLQGDISYSTLMYVVITCVVCYEFTVCELETFRNLRCCMEVTFIDDGGGCNADRNMRHFAAAS
jgi:hypothetical protein